MKKRSLLIIAILAAITAGLASTSAALGSQTKVCEESTYCENVYPPGNEYAFDLSSPSKLRLYKASFDQVGCSSLHIGGEYTEPTGEPAVALVDNVYVSGCSPSFGGTCTMEAIHLPYKMELTAGGSPTGDGTLRITEGTSGGGDPGFRMINCGSWSSCSFTAGEIVTPFTGGELAGLEIPSTALAGCGWNVNMYTEAKADPRLALCGEVCPLAPGALVAAFGTATLVGPFGLEVTCESGLGGNLSQNPAEPNGAIEGDLGIAEWMNCDSGCKVESGEVPWRFEIEANGDAWLEKEGSGKPRMKVSGCVGFPSNLMNNCTFEARETKPGGPSEEALKLTINEGEHPTAEIGAQLKGSCFHPHLDATYSLWPEPLWIENISPPAMSLSPGPMYLM